MKSKTNPLRIRARAPAQALAGLLSAMLASASAAAPPSKMKPCSVLTEAEAAEVMGGTVREKKEDQRQFQEFLWTSCHYNFEALKYASVMVWHLEPGRSAAKHIDTDVSKAKAEFKEQGGIEVAARRIEGLGEAAFWISAGDDSFVNQLQVAKGRYKVMVQVSRVRDALGRSKTLALKVLDRLR
jgi:hypothetical protein